MSTLLSLESLWTGAVRGLMLRNCSLCRLLHSQHSPFSVCLQNNCLKNLTPAKTKSYHNNGCCISLNSHREQPTLLHRDTRRSTVNCNRHHHSLLSPSLSFTHTTHTDTHTCMHMHTHTQTQTHTYTHKHTHI